MVKLVQRYGPSVLLVMSLLGLWQGLAALKNVPTWQLPTPWDILKAFHASWELLLRHTWVTLKEVLAGFGIAVGAGVALAVLIVWSRALERAVYPIVIASQTVPIIAIAPVLVIWFGFGLLPKVVVIALIAFFPVAVNTVDGLKGTDPDLLALARSLGAPRWRTFLKVQLPASLPMFFTGAKMAAAVSVIGAILGEWVGASEGLGYLVLRSSAQFLTARLFAAVVILSVMGVALFYAVALVERWMTPWRQHEKRERLLQTRHP
jgi:ABC-type nitrate/sulfonate/bicarbonate transport system permease component